ncbi:MAG: hypothetical protein R6W89_12750 [Candidatus Hydrogenedentota bacterium]
MAFSRQQSAVWRIAAWSLLILFVAALGHHALPLPGHGSCCGKSCGPLVPQYGDGECGLCLLLGCLTLVVSLFVLYQWFLSAPPFDLFIERLYLPGAAQGPGLPRAPPLRLL